MVPADSQLDETVRGTPRVALGLDVRSLPIGPEEAFVLSRVDGVSSESDIAAVTNLDEQAVARILTRLAELGAVLFEQEHTSAQRVRPFRASPTPTRSGAYRIGPITETQEARASHHPASVQENASELAEVVDLTDAQKLQLLALDARLETDTHYELLGLSGNADSKTVRAAYYELVHVLHPDRFFGKNLGSYKPKITKIFAKLTEAYETLHRAESRAEYDKYLHAKNRTLDFERALLDREQQAAELASAMQRIEQAAQAESLSPEAPKVTSSLPPSSGTSARHSLAPQSEADRRRALARKLGHSSLPPARTSSLPPLPSKTASEHAADELKRRYEARRQRARLDQLRHYVALSDEAAGRNDLAAAANALRIACSLAPEDAELADRLGDLERRASAELWEAYAERAKYAAFEGRHAEAAESFERAALGHPSPNHFERAAFHMLEAGGDLKRASALAKQAVALAPQGAKFRITLAQVYYAAKLRESALAELERARALEPDQALIRDWIERVKRGA